VHSEWNVQQGRDERDQWKLATNIAGRTPRPVNLWIKNIKPVAVKVLSDHRDSSLFPAPRIYKWLEYLDESKDYSEENDREKNHNVTHVK
jgi:hypothetical protein